MFIDKLHKIDSTAIKSINPDAAKILCNVVATYKTILAKRQDLDKRGLKSQPLHIIIGEEHSRPSHKVFQTLLIKALSEAEPGSPLALGLENDRNIGNCHGNAFKMKTVLRKFFNTGQEKTINEKTPQMLKQYMAYHFTNESYYSTRQFINELYKNCDKIVTEFDDASFIPKTGYVNTSDKYVAHCVKQALTQPTDKLTPTDEAGMHIRNLCMARRVDELSQEYGSRLTVQICGQGHVNGLKGIWDHTKSLSAIHKNNNQQIIAVFSAEEVAYPIGLTKSEFFTCSALSQYTARYQPAALTGEWQTQAEIDEKKFVDGIYKALGL